MIACLLLRDGWVVQSIGFQRYLPVGTPEIQIDFLVRWGIDEIALLDLSAWRRGEGPDLERISRLSERCRVPLTVGGGIRSFEQMRQVIRAGAEKVCVNSSLWSDRALLPEGSRRLGTQAIVASVDVRENGSGRPEVYIRGGTQATGLGPVEWARQVEAEGAGEIFLNSIDRDGTGQGYDLGLIRSVAEAVKIPVVACGGVGGAKDFAGATQEAGAAAVAAANWFHFTEQSVRHAKAAMRQAGVEVRL